VNALARKNLFIASETRSGSTYIAEVIAYSFNKAFGFEFWDLTKESFSHFNDCSLPEEIFQRCGSLFLDKSGFVCAKLMCKELSVINRAAQQSDSLRDCFFGLDAHWIVVRRRDRIAQAVSLAMARKSGLYHFYGDPSEAPDRKLNIGIEDISSALSAVALSDVYLGAFVNKLRLENTVEIFYEDFVQDPAFYVNRIADLCKLGSISNEDFDNMANLKRTSVDIKLELKAKFVNWFLGNYGYG
jgi:LPS sulfotransferase NodH